ncbi:acyl-CoA dehydrogenase family protein [Variovorax sp. VNK109]|uniref:acyl-CoA dehydrogenase family protein n=1 Tax=Variovorax sp. VNK109 TaxID=3400919 RepID=UPI003BFD9728
MRLRESEEDQAFRQEVRSFVQAKLPADIRERVLGLRRVERADYVEWQKILAANGWGAPSWPAEHGGCGWSAARRTIFEDECFSAGAPRQLPFGLTMLAPVLMNFGSATLQQRFLPKILHADELWCQGYSEPGSGSDLASLRTRAERNANGYVVNGQKIWTTFAHWADWMFCLVRTDLGSKPQAGISFLLIDMKSKGLTVRPIRTLDHGVDLNEVFFDNVIVPHGNLVGRENEGWSIAKFLLGNERTGIAGVGLAKRFLRRLKEVTAKIPDVNNPLLADVAFRHKLATLEIELKAHEWSLMRTISMEQAGKPIEQEASILKIRGSEIQQALSRLLQEAAGPTAIPYVPEAMDDAGAATPVGAELNALAALYFDMRKASIYGGTNEIQRNIIAKLALG